MSTIKSTITQVVMSLREARSIFPCHDAAKPDVELFWWAYESDVVYSYTIDGFSDFVILGEPANFETIREWVDTATTWGDQLYSDMMSLADFHHEDTRYFDSDLYESIMAVFTAHANPERSS